MTKYEINHSYVIEADDIATIGSTVYNTDKDANLPANTIAKIIHTDPNGIMMRVLKCPTNPSFIDTVWSFNSLSPAEDAHFVHLLRNLEPLATPELLDENIPIDTWSRKYLLEYIAFLEVQ